MPAPVFVRREGATVGVVTVGGCHAGCVEALDQLAAKGLNLDYMRVRGFPFGDEVREFLESHEVNFVVEQNRDGQLRNLLALETGVCCERLDSIRYYAGYPMSAHHVVEGLSSRLRRSA